MQLNPSKHLNDIRDAKRSSDVSFISSAISFYKVSYDSLPSTNGSDLPIVSLFNIMDNGADFTDVDDLEPDFISEYILDPIGNEYKIEQLSDGTVIVAIELSNQDILTNLGLIKAETQNEPQGDLSFSSISKINAQNGLVLGNLTNNDELTQFTYL